MAKGPVLKKLYESRTRRRFHLTSFDPCCHQPEELDDKVARACAAGTDGFLLGGSDGIDKDMVEAYAKALSGALERACEPATRPPLILFPSSANVGLAPAADAVLFLSLLNSDDVRYLIREQALAAPFLPALGLEALGCGMIVVEPGGTVGRVGCADLIKRDQIQRAVGYAAAAEAFGFPLVYLNAGSGSDRPVPPEMIRAVRDAVTVPLIVGGGLTDAEKIRRAAEAGADIVVTGTAIEDAADIGTVVADLANAIHAVPCAESM